MSKPQKSEQVTVKGESVTVWHPEDNSPGFSISMTSGGWLPGVYGSEAAAKLGAECCFTDERDFVKELQQPINHFDKGNRFLTVEDLGEWLSLRSKNKG